MHPPIRGLRGSTRGGDGSGKIKREIFVAPRVRRAVFGLGCLLQGGAIAGALIAWRQAAQIDLLVTGALAAAVLLVGARMSFKWCCGACGSDTTASASTCAGCEAVFRRDRSRK